MPLSSRILLLLLVLLAAWLRFPALFDNHFHADEALFASWARLIAIWRDPLLLAQPVDKPPLLFYLQALAFPMAGPVEWAARLPNLAVSILLVPLTAVFSWRLYNQNLAALVAALIVATSPMAIQFSATAFTDPMMTVLLVAALVWTAAPTKPFWAGLLFGLAVLTKHQAWLFLPLIAGLAWLNNWKSRQWRLMLGGFLPVLVAYFVWGLARRGGLDLWGAQLANFGGVRLAWSWELQPRLASWTAIWPLETGSTALTLVFLLSVPVLIWSALETEFFRKNSVSSSPVGLADTLILLFLFAYLALHWLLAVPVWDRYLLPLVPLIALLLGRALNLIGGRLPTFAYQPALSALIILLLMLQAPSALAARSGSFPAGGRQGADHGAWKVREYLQGAPYGTVLYDHWYSWHWRYAFIDKGVYTSWFEHPAALAEDLRVFGDKPGVRFLVLPDDSVARPVLRAINAAGFGAAPVLRTVGHPGMILYRLEAAKK
jgi:4-amino-4-deoxy-L-arabinose transferase-like glycosyltransferase